jgi:hypothetical protein
MVTRRGSRVYGYVVLALLMFVLLAVWFELVPRSWYWPMLLIAGTLFMVRLTLKLVLERQRRLEHAGGTAGPAPVSRGGTPARRGEQREG